VEKVNGVSFIDFYYPPRALLCIFLENNLIDEKIDNMARLT